MDLSKKTLTILHFNDVYTIQEQKKEPIGGIARFKTALDSFASLDPLILFSGDLFSPSTLTPLTHGEHLVYPMNAFGVHAACLGNHDFDIDLEFLEKWMGESTYPWLLTNVIDKETNEPLGGGKSYHVIEKSGYRIGLFGLAELDWISILRTIEPEDCEYEDFVVCAKRMNEFLRNEEKCDLVIAMTHMRNHNDELLAKSFDGLDLILGGHDHVNTAQKINGTYYIKSGCEFREFNKITLTPIEGQMDLSNDKQYKNKFLFDVETIEVTSKWEPNPELQAHVESYQKKVQSSMDKVLAHTAVDLETTFSKIRTSEQNITNFIADIVRLSTKSEIAIIQSGSVRSDCLFKKGPITFGDLKSMLPYVDIMVELKVTGEQLHKALEAGVSKYPALEGRFPIVSGFQFAFDPKKEVGSRVPLESININKRGPLKYDETYLLATSLYLSEGKDGYGSLKDAEMLTDAETGDHMNLLVTKFFELAGIPDVVSSWKAEKKNAQHIHDMVFKNIPALLRRQMTLIRKRVLFEAAKPLINEIIAIDGVDSIEIAPTIEGRIKILN